MTTNNPKIAVHRYKERPDDLRSAWLYTRRAGHVPLGHHGEALIRLTDYEALQAELAAAIDAAPQPVLTAPDVSALVEALTMARETIASALRANAPDYFTTDADIARHVVIQRIDNAMQGGKP